MSFASKVLGSWQGKASRPTTSMSGFAFSNVFMSSSKLCRSIFALLGGMQLTVMRVLPPAELSPSEPQAASPVRARAVTMAVVRVRRNPELLIGGTPLGQERGKPPQLLAVWRRSLNH